MLKAVFDSNIFISGFLFNGNQRLLLEQLVEGKIKVFISKEILDEIKDVLNRPKFRLSSEKVNFIINEIESVSEVCFPKQKINDVCRDLKDHIVLECAVEANADYIVTGDSDLLILEKFQQIKIVDSMSMIRIGSR